MSIFKRIERALVRQHAMHPASTRLAKPLASFSFDDVPKSAIDVAAPILESRGVRGTYYVCGSLEAQTYRDLPHFSAVDLKSLAERGHEIGCHAYDHIPYPAAGAEALKLSLLHNRDYIRARLGDYQLASFAYPFGDVDWAVKSVIARTFPIARGVLRGINAGRMDFSELRANPLDRRWESATDIPGLIKRACRRRGWLIFFTHDVQDNPSSEGCSPDRLKRTLDAVLEAGCDVLPVKNAAARAKFG
jgi:peptidoglycan/xylan/chitin deacetylase (PgdA/CDA1 family)